MNESEKMAALVIGSLFGLFVVFSIGGDIIGYVSGSKTSSVPIQSGVQTGIQSGVQTGDQYYESPRSGNHDYNDTSPRSPSGGKSKSKKNKRVNKRNTRVNKRTNK